MMNESESHYAVRRRQDNYIWDLQTAELWGFQDYVCFMIYQVSVIFINTT
jgi:hypothetical protein